MNNFACNPYLPLYEYVPDGEPRVFGDRLYIYGSHDRCGGDFFCLDDYVVWSAPLDDLNSWRLDGTSYRKDQDPHNPDGKWELFAPDVVCGPDGRYYLFYCLRMQKEFGVAVSDSPAGPFSFYGHIHRPDGSIFDEFMPYDPAVLCDDDGRVYLYYGYTSPEIAARFGATVSKGCMVIELAQDMLTVINGPAVCLPKKEHIEGTGFEGHGYYEAPSIRKIGDLYYLVYSSQVCHELCYAVSSRPAEGFTYGGVIISNGDIGLNGRSYPVCLPGNNHGGIVCVKGQYYIFYQRHTQCTQFSRQGCAEKITIQPDGSIPQVEVTTGGISGNPLPAEGTWSAARACYLSHRDGRKMLLYREADPDILPCIWEDTDGNSTCATGCATGDRSRGCSAHGDRSRGCNADHRDLAARCRYIRGITDGTIIGFKYFEAKEVTQITLSLRGSLDGRMDIMTDDPVSGTCIGYAELADDHASWQDIKVDVTFDGIHSLFLVYHGEGRGDLQEIRF